MIENAAGTQRKTKAGIVREVASVSVCYFDQNQMRASLPRQAPPSAAAFPLTTAEVWALLAVAAAGALQALPGAPEALEYQRAQLAAQPWRLIGGHLVHLNWAHLGVNGAAWWLAARLFAQDLRATQQMGIVVASFPVISLSLAFLWPEIAWYRGLSGALHALFFAGSASWLCREGLVAGRPAPGRLSTARPYTAGGGPPWLAAALFSGGWIKVLAEQPWSTHLGTLRYAQWLHAPVVTQAHLAGAAFGTFAGLVLVGRTGRGRGRKKPVWT